MFGAFRRGHLISSHRADGAATLGATEARFSVGVRLMVTVTAPRDDVLWATRRIERAAVHVLHVIGTLLDGGELLAAVRAGHLENFAARLWRLVMDALASSMRRAVRCSSTSMNCSTK